jgi:hypothetical protein
MLTNAVFGIGGNCGSVMGCTWGICGICIAGGALAAGVCACAVFTPAVPKASSRDQHRGRKRNSARGLLA